MKRKTIAELEGLNENYRLAADERDRRLETLYAADKQANLIISDLKTEVRWLRQLTQNLSEAVCARSHR